MKVASDTRSFAESTRAKLAGLGDRDKRLLLLALRFERPLLPTTIAQWFEVNQKTVHNWIKEWLRIGLLDPASGKVRVRSYKIGERYRDVTIDELGFTES